MSQAKDIADAAALDAVRAVRGRGIPEEAKSWAGQSATLWDVQAELAGFPPKVVQRKLGSMVRRGILKGCACGCRGDFELPLDKPPEIV